MVAGNSLNDHGARASGGESEAGPGGELVELARAAGRAQDPYARQLVGEALVLEALANPAISRVNALLEAGRVPPAGAAIIKLLTSVSDYRIREIALEIGGTRAVMSGADDPVGGHAQRWLGARIRTLAGGSNEMQRNAISERILGLPREPSPDSGVPFSQVLAARRRA